MNKFNGLSKEGKPRVSLERFSALNGYKNSLITSAGERAQLVNYLLSKNEELSSSPGSTYKSWNTFVIPALGGRNSKTVSLEVTGQPV